MNGYFSTGYTPVEGMTELTPWLIDADPANLPTMAA
jgi:hypothetical protein